MELLVQQGKVIYVGSSNFAGWDIATAQCAAAARHFMGLVSEQSLYNLTRRTVELEVIPACRHYGLGLIPWSPLGGGLLGGALRKGRRRPPCRRDARRSSGTGRSWRPTRRSVGSWAKSPADVALAWLLHNPAVTAPIIGPRTVEQLTGSLRAARAIAFRRDAPAARRDLARPRR